MPKSSGASVTCAILQNFMCWDAPEISQSAQLKFDFRVIFTRLLSETAAKITQRLVVIALRKLHH